jgi:hypothetical protein
VLAGLALEIGQLVSGMRMGLGACVSGVMALLVCFACWPSHMHLERFQEVD